MSHEKIKTLAPDLRTTFPRSSRETFARYIHAGRLLDKCRAVLAGTNGEYHFNCPLDRYFFDFTGIDAEDFKAFVASGADDASVAGWIAAHSKIKEFGEVVAWNNKMRDLRISDLPLPLQLFLEDYVPKVVPKNRTVRVWFDVYDFEEGRL